MAVVILSLMSVLLAAVGMRLYDTYTENREIESELKLQEEVLSRNREAHDRVQEMRREIEALSGDREKLGQFLEEIRMDYEEAVPVSALMDFDTGGMTGNQEMEEAQNASASEGETDASGDGIISENTLDGSEDASEKTDELTASGQSFPGDGRWPDNALHDGASVDDTVSGNAFGVSEDDTISDNTIGGSGNESGIQGSTAVVSGNTIRVSGNMTTVSGNMISVSDNATSMSDNTATVSGNGVSVSGNDMVSGNEVSTSGNDVVSGNGISVSGNDMVSGNGISVSGSDMVSGNGISVSGNDMVSGNGISVSGSDMVSGNALSASGNSVVSGNTSASVSGNMQDLLPKIEMVYPEITLAQRRQIRGSLEETLLVNWEDQACLEERCVDFSGKKIACLGDSITAAANLEKEEGYPACSYPSVLKEILGAEEVYNLGIGGSSIGRYWSDAFVERYTQIPEDTDIIIVMGGTNDGFCLSGKEFGSLTQRKTRTFCGDLDELMRGLKEKYPDADIFFATPLPNILQDYLMRERTYLLPQKNIADMILTLSANYDFQVIDLYNSNMLDSHDADIVADYMPDGVHANKAGYRILAEHIAAELVRYYEEE